MSSTAIDSEYRQARESAVVFDHSSRSKIELTGPEALMFLHNLCTQDVKNLQIGEGREAFLTTAKAKIIAHFLIGRFAAPRDGDFVLLDTVPGQADKVLAHLNHFLISEQVELADRTSALGQLHVCGPRADAIVQAALGEPVKDLRELANRTLRGTDGEPIFLRRNDVLGLPGFDLFCPHGTAAALCEKLTTGGAVPAGEEVWNVLRLESAWPVYGIDMDDNRLAMEVGRTSAISYTKGCYLGQETIVMARDRGHVNRMLTLLQIEQPAAAGARVFAQQQEVGQVTSSAVSPRFGAIALAYIRRGFWEPAVALKLNEPDKGPIARVLAIADKCAD